MEEIISSIIILIIVTSLFAILLFLYLKNLKKVREVVNKRNTYYRRKIKRLKNSKKNPKEILGECEKLMKQFLKEYLQLSYEPTHDELVKELEKKKKIKFSSIKILDKIYSNEEVSNEEIQKILTEFEKLVEKYKIIEK